MTVPNRGKDPEQTVRGISQELTRNGMSGELPWVKRIFAHVVVVFSVEFGGKLMSDGRGFVVLLWGAQKCTG